MYKLMVIVNKPETDKRYGFQVNFYYHFHVRKLTLLEH